jgi:hypothetical protein
MPLSSAREISGHSMSAAIVAAPPIRRMFDSLDVMAMLRAAFTTNGGYLKRVTQLRPANP